MPPTDRLPITPSLAALRDELSALDAKFVELLRQRVDVARRIGTAKRKAQMATLDPQREAEVAATVGRLARQAGLPTDAVQHVFEPIVAMCRRAQEADGR